MPGGPFLVKKLDFGRFLSVNIVPPQCRTPFQPLCKAQLAIFDDLPRNFFSQTHRVLNRRKPI